MKLLLLSLSLMITNCYADLTETEDAVHSVAHFGATYALTHIGEVVCKKTTGQSKLACTVESALIANAINVGRKAAQGFPDDTQRASIAGGLGSLGAALVITIDW